jgi:tetraacyldisaccharide 4'-kinase
MKGLLAVYSVVSRAVCRFKRALYKAGIRKAARAPLTVISVGNLALGGSEKTPLALDLLGFLLEIGRKPALVTRGYKGAWEKSGGVLSDGRKILGTWREGGDEPALAALRHPKAGVYVGRDRLASCRRAHQAGFDVAVLDDGFQHLRLGRDLDIVLHDPRGRVALREGLSALRGAGIILTKRGPAGSRPGAGRATVFEYSVREGGIVPLEDGPERPLGILKDRAFFAFCGIARPERFFEMLETSGVRPAGRAVFPDHFDYPGRALARLAADARAAGCAVLLTTEKDAVKIRDRRGPLAGLEILVLRIGLDLPAEFYAHIRVALGPGPRGDGA